MLVPTEEQLSLIEKSIRYDPDNGEFTWRDHRRRKKPYAGSCDKDGYTRIMVNYKMYHAAPVGWFLYYHEWPLLFVDHKDRNPRNNRIWNLRLASYSLNAYNSYLRIDNTTGFKGVSWEPRTGSWYVRIGRKYIGTFYSYADACEARLEAERVYTHS